MNTFIGIIGVVIFAGIILTFNDRKKNKIICSNQNCGYKGMGKTSGGKSIIVFILLLCLGILPGLIYMAWPMQKKLSCPQCGTGIR